MEAKHFIALQNVAHQYGSREILKNITHTFSNNNVTILLGKSGSGKSTLLQLLNGMERPTEGVVRVFGEALNYQKISSLRLRIGYVVQQVGLFPHLNLFENIGLLGKITNMPKIALQNRIRELMEIVQLPATFGKKFPHELSGGEAQRVGLCRALLLKPSLLLMDEPFAALDFSTKQTLYEYFCRLQQSEPCTVVWVTHDWHEAITLADEYIWLDKGCIRSNGTKKELPTIKEQYQTV